jgi:hypothetical protein
LVCLQKETVEAQNAVDWRSDLVRHLAPGQISIRIRENRRS